jgi:hypothetical protein
MITRNNGLETAKIVLRNATFIWTHLVVPALSAPKTPWTKNPGVCVPYSESHLCQETLDGSIRLGLKPFDVKVPPNKRLDYQQWLQ